MINEFSIPFDNFVEQSKKKNHQLYLIMFKASWCSPCKIIYPKIEELSEEYPNVKFYKLEIDDESELIQEYINYFKPTKVPSFFYYKNGKILDIIIGTDINKIYDFLEKNL